MSARAILRSRRGWRRPGSSRLHRVVFEQLEPRALLSATPLSDIVAQPLFTGPFQPSQITQAYNFKSLTFSGGSVAANGSGQTIAIVDAYNDPNITGVTGDLAKFDAQWGLPAPPSFTKVMQVVGGRAPATNSGWTWQIALDVEWAHAIAPAANILLVEANTASLSNLLSAVSYAANYPGVSVVSMSWGSSEFSGETAYDSSVFTTPSGHTPVSFVAASGDSGSPGLWPAFSPNVLAVGGTSLTTQNSSGTYGSETGWSGSGGGISLYETVPAFQRGWAIAGLSTTSTMRTIPDVAYNADPNTGYYVYDSVPYAGYRGWWEVGGTSAAVPQWAAPLAIADQGRALAGKSVAEPVSCSLLALCRFPRHWQRQQRRLSSGTGI